MFFSPLLKALNVFPFVAISHVGFMCQMAIFEVIDLNRKWLNGQPTLGLVLNIPNQPCQIVFDQNATLCGVPEAC
jgi:hypothetical protein